MTLRIHPVAEMFPLLEGAAFDALVQDIRTYGLREPILVDADNQIIDGRNRLRACAAAQRLPRFELWSGDDPTALIISRNLHRRHLSESQRALIAARLATLGEGRPSRTASIEAVPKSQSQAAELLNVGRASVQRAREVIERGSPEVIEAIERGDLAVSAAATELRAGRNPLDVHFRSDSPEHYTPTHILDAAIECLGAIDLDPCSNSHESPHVPAARHFTREDDGLAQPWTGRVFLNPPYGREIDLWIAKLVDEVMVGHVPGAIALVPGRIDTAWWARLRDFVWCNLEGRLTFVGNTDPAPFPSVVVYLDGEGNGLGPFYRAFAPLGDIWQRIEPDMFG